MAYILRKIGNADNIAVNYYEVDTERDMWEIDVSNAPMGSRCYVINTGSTYALNSSKEWKLVPTSGGETPSGGTKEPMIVTFTVTDPSTFALKADTPYADIMAAAEAGRIVYAFVPEAKVFGTLSSVVSNHIYFSGIDGNNSTIITIDMSSDSVIFGSRESLITGQWDQSFFDADDRRITNVLNPTDANDAATKGYVDNILTAGNNDSVVIKSSTPNSTKKFRITVDDAGTISATEVQ